MEQRGVWVIRVCHCSDAPEHRFLLREEQDHDFPYVSSSNTARGGCRESRSKSIPYMNFDSEMWVKSQPYKFCRQGMRTWTSDTYVSDGFKVIIPQCTLKEKNFSFLWIPMKSNTLKDLDLKPEGKESGWPGWNAISKNNCLMLLIIVFMDGD